MKTNFKQLIREAKSIGLTDDDRASMRAHFAELTGVQETTARQSWGRFFSMHRKAAMGFGMAMVTIMATSGMAAAAEGAMPGDALYPLKVHVTEEVRSVLARTPEAKAAWETKRVERRLSEAEKVIQKQPSTATINSIQLNIAAHTERVQKSIDSLERSGKVEAAAVASSDIEAPLTAHKAILQELTKSEKHADRLLKKIENEEEKLQDRRMKLEARVEAETKKEDRKTGEDKKEDTSFRTRERTRRQIREDQLLEKARIELNVSARPSEDKPNQEDDGSAQTRGGRNRND